MYKITLKRFTAFFLCFVLFLGILPLNLFTTVQAAEESSLGTNPNCSGKHGENGVARGYCLDIGFGQCMPYKIIKEVGGDSEIVC